MSIIFMDIFSRKTELTFWFCHYIYQNIGLSESQDAFFLCALKVEPSLQGSMCQAVPAKAHPKTHRNPRVPVRMDLAHLNSLYLQCSCWEKPNQLIWFVLRSCSQQPCDKTQHLQGLLGCGAPSTWSLQTKPTMEHSSKCGVLQRVNLTHYFHIISHQLYLAAFPVSCLYKPSSG